MHRARLGAMPAIDETTRASRVLVVDDHPVVREGVALLMGKGAAMHVAGTAQTGGEAIAVARDLAPDLILLDLRLPDMLASETVEQLRLAAPRAKIVVFTAYAAHQALDTLRDRVDGILLKDATDTDLVAALGRVLAGERVIDPRIGNEMLPGRPAKWPGPQLTGREYEVLRRVAMGETNAEVADKLFLSRNTVKTYLQSALHKLGAKNRVEGILRARQAGLL